MNGNDFLQELDLIKKCDKPFWQSIQHLPIDKKMLDLVHTHLGFLRRQRIEMKMGQVLNWQKAN